MLDEAMIQQALQIRYVRLQFTLQLTEECLLPVHKASAIRGGIGEMLLRANCINDRQCDQCEYADECIVQRTMYSKFLITPGFVTAGESVGYVIECEDLRQHYREGEQLTFRLLLFGKTIVYFNLYLQAIAALGQCGLGKEQAGFIVTDVKNQFGQRILENQNIYMKNYKTSRVSDYVAYRKQKLEDTCVNQIIFKSPVTIKYHGELLTEFQMPALMKAIQRRIYMLDCFEAIPMEELYREELIGPEILSQQAASVAVRRFSYRKEQAMYMDGITGTIRVNEILEDELELLLAGELLHVGKYTSFGFGRYWLTKR